MSSSNPIPPVEDPSSPLFFLRSPVFVSIAVAFVSKLLTLFGRHVSDDIINADVQQVLDLVTLASLGFAGFKRWRSSMQPLSVKPTGVSNASNDPSRSPPGNQPPAA